MSILDDAAGILVSNSIGVIAASSGWGIYISEEPLEPDTVITLFDAGGLPPNPKWLLDYPSIQIRVRGARGGYVAARQKIVDIRDALLGLTSQTIGDTRWVSVTMPGDITPLGYDDSKRPLLVVNFRLIIEPAASALTNRTAI